MNTLLYISIIVFYISFVNSSPLDSFLSPLVGSCALNADLIPVTQQPDIASCASLCLSTPDCISFNACQNGTAYRCGCSGYSMAYDVISSAQCNLYTRIQPRNDSPVVQSIQWNAHAPTFGSVTLFSGLIGDSYVNHFDTYLLVRDPDDMLVFFAERANKPSTGQCFGWDLWIKGSATGNYLMGAGSYLQWSEDDTLRARLQSVVDGIIAYQEPNGWMFAFNESDIGTDNLPDYCKSWVMRGLIDASNAGIKGALDIGRSGLSYFNNHSQLAFFLPQNGGPNPVQPYPAGFDNTTHGGYGQPSGHMIYIEYQGMIAHTLMAQTEKGTQADIDVVQRLYLEQWWIDALVARDEFHAIWHRQFFSHNYEQTAFEAILDLYVLTGNTTYFTAVQNAWSMVRESFIHVGGSFAINENNYYPPKSYFIGFTGPNVASAHSHSHSHSHSHAHTHPHDKQDYPPFYHAPCMPGPGVDEPYSSPLQFLKRDAMKQEEKDDNSIIGPNDNDPPTGELCGSVFWSFLNQRFHYLDPLNETYVAEIERSIINVGIAALGLPGSGGQGPNGTGIRYFANNHKQKQNPSMHASCCEGQGTRLFGSLPKFIYTVDGTAANVNTIYVDLYTASSLKFQIVSSPGTLTQETNWPYDNDVKLTLSLPAATSFLTLALRIPYWVNQQVSVTVNGAVYKTQGTPESYLQILPDAGWNAGDNTITFSLGSLTWTAYNYTGSSQLPGYTRASFLLGPILMSFQGPWDNSSDSLVMPKGLDPLNPSAWLIHSGSGNTLEFNVTSDNRFTVKPYYAVQGPLERFTNYPSFS